MITRDLVAIALKTSHGCGSPIDRERGEQWIAERGENADKWELISIPTCECCGQPATYWMNRESPTHARCRKHHDRNPCLVEGCGRSFKAEDGYGTNKIICGRHWREFVPVGSPERRIYLRFFRRAKKFDWNDNSIRAFHRFWDALAKRARAKARGDIDMDEVNRLMGWDKAA
jgi:hypothetical protein